MGYNKSTTPLVSKSTSCTGHRHPSHKPIQMVSIQNRKSPDHEAIPTASGSPDAAGVASLVVEVVSAT